MSIVTTIRRSNFLKHNAVFFFGSLLVGALNYLYYPVLGRLTDPETFGEIQTLVSLFLQFTIFLNVLGIITVNIVTNYADKTKAHHVIFELEKLAAYLALALLAISILGGEILRSSLHFASALPFTALALALLASIPLTFRSAYARSQKRFGIASISQLISAGVKLILSVGLVLLGLGTTGAVGGIVIAQVIAFFYAARWAGRLGFSRPEGVNYSRLPDLKIALPELKYAGFVLGGLLSITLIMSIDIIFVKHFFDATTAGLYAGIATVARIIFFLATPIAQVLMPMVKIGQPARANRQLLIKSIGLTLLVTLPVLLVCVIWPRLAIDLLMGHRYDAFAPVLPLLATAIFLASIMNLLCMYFLSLRLKALTIIAIMGFVVSLILMSIWHDDVRAIVTDMLMGSTLMLCATGIYVLVNLRRGGRDAKPDGINRHTNL